MGAGLLCCYMGAALLCCYMGADLLCCHMGADLLCCYMGAEQSGRRSIPQGPDGGGRLPRERRLAQMG
jgi:hypothetical protein